MKKNKALGSLNDKLLEKLNDRRILASFLLSPLSKITNPENNRQFKLVRDPSSNGVNDLVTIDTTPVYLYNNLPTFRQTDEKFELQEDLLKMITNKNYNVDRAKLSKKNNV